MNDRRLLPAFALFTLLLLLALRLTITESFQNSYFPPDPATLELRQPGPATTVTFTIITLLAAAATAFSHRLARRDLIHLFLLAAVLAFATCSAFHAANRFTALIGTCDLAIALVAGWSFSLLLANTYSRHLAFSLLVALSAVWLAKAANQYFFEIPDTIAFYQEHKAEIAAQHHWQPDDAAQTLFEYRMNSRELTSFSPFANVFAAELLVPLLLSAAFIVMIARRSTFGVVPDSPLHNVQRQTSNVQRKNVDSPATNFRIPHSAFPIPFALLLAATAATLWFTDSKGALGCAIVALPLLLLCFLFSDIVSRHRRALTLALLTAALLGTIALFTYGLLHHALPTLSLLYRWQYWSGTAPIIRSHSLLGVGLNNFGSYYLQTKLPLAPEDVSDPHSFFIRLAAELGLPATLLLAGLLLCLILRPLLSRAAPSESTNAPTPFSPGNAARFITHTAAFILLWFFLRVLLAEPLDENSLAFTLYMNLFYALLAAAAFLFTAYALRRFPYALPPLLYTLLAAALAMFLYDQINMALVTGPAAMLFFALLAAVQPLSASNTPQISVQSPFAFRIPHFAFLLFLLPALALSFFVLPALLQNNFPLDPAPPARLAALALANNDPASALTSLATARARDPLSLQLLRWQIQAKLALHQPAAPDLRQLLSLHPYDPRTLLELAQLDSDLPTPDRIAALQSALQIDSALDPIQPKRLSPDQRTAAQSLLTQLQPPPPPPLPSTTTSQSSPK